MASPFRRKSKGRKSSVADEDDEIEEVVLAEEPVEEKIDNNQE